jgi:hypothetical protein
MCNSLGVCRFKKVDFLDTLFIGFLIGIASIYISGFIGLCTASLTQTEVKTETYKNVNYYISHGKLFAYNKENVYITAATEDDSYTDFSIVKKQDMAEGENILVKETYQGALKNYSCLFLGKQPNILFMRKENNYVSSAYMYDSRSYVF